MVYGLSLSFRIRSKSIFSFYSNQGPFMVLSSHRQSIFIEFMSLFTLFLVSRFNLWFMFILVFTLRVMVFNLGVAQHMVLELLSIELFLLYFLCLYYAQGHPWCKDSPFHSFNYHKLKLKKH